MFNNPIYTIQHNDDWITSVFVSTSENNNMTFKVKTTSPLHTIQPEAICFSWPQAKEAIVDQILEVNGLQ